MSYNNSVTNNNNPVTNSNNSDWTPETVEKVFVPTALRVIQEIGQDTERRANSNNPEDLKRGVFYSNDYFAHLQKPAFAKKFESITKFFKSQGIFYHGYAPTGHFKMKKEPANIITGMNPSCFYLKEGVLPTDALKAFRKGLTLPDCGAICEVAYYEALRKVWGEEKFNKIFAADSPTPLMVGSTDESTPNPIKALYSGKAKLAKGALVFFSNIPEYAGKHQNGEFGGMNTLCLDATPKNEKFVGFGLNPDGVTANQLREEMRQEYNQTSLGLDFLSEKDAKKFPPYDLQVSELLKDHQFTKAEFKQDWPGIQIIQTLDMQKICKLANISTDKAQAEFTRMYKKLSPHPHTK